MQSPKPIDVICPSCGSQKAWRDGIRDTHKGNVQRWLCRDCGYRFSEKPLLKNHNRSLNSPNDLGSNSQLWSIKQEAKKLTTAIETKTIAGESPQDIKGKIVEFSFWMLKQGYSKSTIKTRSKILKRLVRLEADIFNPESIKETIAKTQWSTGRKCIAIDAYTCFLKMQNLKWDPPIVNRIRKLPYSDRKRD